MHILDRRIDHKGFLHAMEKFFGKKEDLDLVMQALDWAIELHDGQMRKYEGIPYVTHPMAVAVDLAERYGDKDLTIAGLLHDVVEDCEATFQEVYNKYGKAVGYMVEAVSKKPLFFVDEPEVVYGDKIEKLLAGGMQDVRVLLLKIADRDHNLKTLEGLKPNKQIRMTFETQAIYEPLREILLDEGNQVFSLKKIRTSFLEFLEGVNAEHISCLKQRLYTKTFKRFDNDDYKIVYENTDAIVWKIENKAFLETMLLDEEFNNSITILNIQEDHDGFECNFTIDKGLMFRNTIDGIAFGNFRR